jgi:hypothetical protein
VVGVPLKMDEAFISAC